MPRLIVICVFCLMVLVLSCHADTEADLWGLPVHYIRFESSIELPEDLLLTAIAIDQGSPLTPDGLRKCLKNLDLLNRFSSVTAYAEPMLDGCALLFKLEPNWQVDDIIFRGGTLNVLFNYGLSGRFSPKSLSREIGLKKGDVYNENFPQFAIESLKDFYYRNGYAQSSIEFKDMYNDSLGTVDLIFEIDQGEPTTISKVRFDGNKTFDVRQLLITSDLFVSKKFSQNTLSEARKRLENYYQKRGFLSVKVFRPEVRYISETNSVEISIEINEGHAVDMQIVTDWHTWNVMWWFYFLENRPDLFLDALGIENRGKFDSEVMEVGCQRLENIFKNHGYLNVDVSFTEKVDPTGKITYIFNVDEQDPVEVSSVFVVGNATFTTEELFNENIIATQPEQRYHLDTFIADQNDLLSFYQNEGYQDAKIIGGCTSSDDTRKVSVGFNIEEGPLYLWNEITIEGNKKFSREEILNLLEVKCGGPHNIQVMDSNISKLVDQYLQLGYAEVTIDREIDPSIPLRPSLKLIIHEGIPSTIDSVLVTGYSKTRLHIIEDNLPDLKGKPFYYQNLMDAERKLAKTNLFRSVDVSGLQREAGSADRTVVVRLREQPFVYLECGPGYNTDRGFNGYLSFYTTNLGGANRYLGASSSISEEDNKSNVIYREPEFANLPVQLELRLLTENSREDGYRLRRRGGRATWSYWLLDQMRLLAVYRFDDDDPYEIDENTDLPEEFHDAVKIASLSPGLLYDSRDDPRDPKSGSLFSLKVEFARSVYSSEVNFTKTTAEATHFFDLPGKGVFGAAFRFGFGSHLPYQERFRLGGIKTIRGWDYEDIEGQAAESDNLISENSGSYGNIMFLSNLEFRHPLFWGLESVVFLDTGNVFDNRSDVKFNNLKSTLGLGIRIMTPVGPVGVDYGYNILREDDDPRSKWSFIIGHTF